MALPRHRTTWAITLALGFLIFFPLDVLARGGGRSSDYTRPTHDRRIDETGTPAISARTSGLRS